MRIANCDVSASQVREMFDFNPDTGIFTRKMATRVGGVGSFVGWLRNGYWVLTINRKKYLAHRIAWLYFHGHHPKDSIDHINRNRLDNRIVNLRDVPHHKNMQNIDIYKSNNSGQKGVDRQVNGAWRARIRVDGKRIYLGCFRDFDLATKAYRDAQDKYHGASPWAV